MEKLNNCKLIRFKFKQIEKFTELNTRRHMGGSRLMVIAFSCSFGPASGKHYYYILI